MEIVAKAYNTICDQWAAYREGCVVNQCIVQFATLLPAGASVLDIGCGTAHPIDTYLVGQGMRVHCIDIAQRMIECARARCLPNAVFEVADIATFCPQRRYDAIVAFDSLWHLPYDDQAATMARVVDMLQPGGYLLLTHGIHDGQTEGDMWGQRFYYSALDLSHLLDVLARSGMRILSCQVDYLEPTTGHRELLLIAQKQE